MRRISNIALKFESFNSALTFAAFAYIASVALAIYRLTIYKSTHSSSQHLLGFISQDALISHDRALKIVEGLHVDASQFFSLNQQYYLGINTTIEAILLFFGISAPLFYIVSLNVALHVFSGYLLFQIAYLMRPNSIGKTSGLILAIIYFLIPTPFLWLSQSLKEPFVIFSIFSYCYVLLRIHFGIFSPKPLFRPFLTIPIITGATFLIATTRPYLLLITSISAALYLLVILRSFVGLINGATDKSMRIHLIKSVFSICILASAPLMAYLCIDGPSNSEVSTYIDIISNTGNFANQWSWHHLSLPSFFRLHDKSQINSIHSILSPFLNQCGDLFYLIDSQFQKIAEVRYFLIAYGLKQNAEMLTYLHLPSNIFEVPVDFLLGLFHVYKDIASPIGTTSPSLLRSMVFYESLPFIITLPGLIALFKRDLKSFGIVKWIYLLCLAVTAFYAFVNPSLGTFWRMTFAPRMFMLLVNIQGCLWLVNRLSAYARNSLLSKTVNSPSNNPDPQILLLRNLEALECTSENLIFNIFPVLALVIASSICYFARDSYLLAQPSSSKELIDIYFAIFLISSASTALMQKYIYPTIYSASSGISANDHRQQDVAKLFEKTISISFHALSIGFVAFICLAVIVSFANPWFCASISLSLPVIFVVISALIVLILSSFTSGANALLSALGLSRLPALLQFSSPIIGLVPIYFAAENISLILALSSAQVLGAVLNLILIIYALSRKYQLQYFGILRVNKNLLCLTSLPYSFANIAVGALSCSLFPVISFATFKLGPGQYANWSFAMKFIVISCATLHSLSRHFFIPQSSPVDPSRIAKGLCIRVKSLLLLVLLSLVVCFTLVVISPTIGMVVGGGESASSAAGVDIPIALSQNAALPLFVSVVYLLEELLLINKKTKVVLYSYLFVFSLVGVLFAPGIAMSMDGFALLQYFIYGFLLIVFLLNLKRFRLIA